MPAIQSISIFLLVRQGETQEVMTESISEVYTEECQEKHWEWAHPSLPSWETQMSMEEVKL